MPNSESSERLRLPRRRLRRHLVTDYIPAPTTTPTGVPSELEAYIRPLLESAAVQDRIQRELAASPTARLALAVHDLDPSDCTKHAFLTHSPTGEQYFTGATERTVDDSQAVPASVITTPHQAKPLVADSIVARLHETHKNKGEDAALDYIYEAFHPLIIRDRDVARAARILLQVNVDELPSSILIGLLMTTYSQKGTIDSRPDFLTKVKARLRQLPDGDAVAPYLSDLE